MKVSVGVRRGPRASGHRVVGLSHQQYQHDFWRQQCHYIRGIVMNMSQELYFLIHKLYLFTCNVQLPLSTLWTVRAEVKWRLGV